MFAAKRLGLLFVLLLSLAACDSTPVTNPTGPPPQPSSDLPRQETVSYRVLGGVVDGTGAPVGAAEIAFPSAPIGTSRLIITDADGRFDVTIQLAGQPQRKSTPARVQKPGYEPAVHWLSVDPNASTTRDLRLHRIQQVLPGELLHLTISPDDPVCGFEGYLCRRIRVASAFGGRLVIGAEAASGTTLTVVQADLEPWPATDRLIVATGSGSVVSADVAILGGPPGSHQVVVRTGLEE